MAKTTIRYDRSQNTNRSGSDRLTTGASKQSRLVIARDNLHIFIFTPSQGNNCFGVTVRHRKNGGWNHHRLVLLQHNARSNSRIRQRTSSSRQGKIRSRLTLTVFELSSWRTEPDLFTRVGLKSYQELSSN